MLHEHLIAQNAAKGSVSRPWTGSGHLLQCLNPTSKTASKCPVCYCATGSALAQSVCPCCEQKEPLASTRKEGWGSQSIWHRGALSQPCAELAFTSLQEDKQEWCCLATCLSSCSGVPSGQLSWAEGSFTPAAVTSSLLFSKIPGL